MNYQHFFSKVERSLKKIGRSCSNKAHMKVCTYVFVSIGCLSSLLYLLFHPSLFWSALQLVMWICLGCLLFYMRREAPIPLSLQPLVPVLQEPQLLGEERATYNSSVEVDTQYGDTYERLESFFNSEKPYLISGINIADVAFRLGTNKAFLSRFINERLNLNFNQFVNSYRVKEAQHKIEEQGMIALEKLCKMVGFTSMATFTVAFKLNTGMTPGEWCKKYKRRAH